jgi:hypothetical protein
VRRLVLVVLGCIGGILSRCSADGEPAVVAGADASPDGGAPCIDREEGNPAGSVCIRTVRLAVVDDVGAPVPDLPLTVCGDLCVWGQTDGDGRAQIDVRRWLRKPYARLHGRARFAGYVVPLSGDGAVDLGELVAPRLPTSTVPVTSGTLSSGDLSLHIPDGAKVTVDTIELAPDERGFAAVRVDVAKAPPWARGDERLVGLWALAPFDTNVVPGAGVRIAQSFGLAAGTRVELVGHDPTADASSTFTKVGEATVTADGALESDPTTPLVRLTWLGVRR